MPEKLKCIVKPEQAKILREVCEGIETKCIGGSDLSKVFNLHLSILEEEKVSVNDIAIHNARKWIISNILRVIDDQYINPSCSPAVQILLNDDYTWVIDNLVKLHEIIQMDKAVRRTFIRMISRIFRDLMRAEVFMTNMTSSEVDLTQVIALFDEDDELIDNLGNNEFENILC